MDKFYIPKMSIGDKMWVMKNNRPIEVKVVYVEIGYGKDFNDKISTSVKYYLSDDAGYKYECTDSSPGDFIYLTKKDLLNSL